MRTEDLTVALSSFITTYPLFAAGIGIFLALFLWKKPWDFLKMSVLAILLVLGIYAAMEFGQSAKVGTEGKRTMTTETEQRMSDR